MKLNSRGTDVMNLQKVLNMYSQTTVAKSGVGSSGMETSTFGPATRAAVNKFQALHLAELGVTAPTGNVFAGTRGLLNQVCTGSEVSTNPGNTLPAGCTSTSGFSSLTGVSCSTGVSTNPGTVVSGPVSAALSSVQPVGTVVAGQASAVLANVTLTGNGTVSAMEFQRTGVSSDDTLVNVYLYEGNTRISDAASVITGGYIRFSSSNGVVAVNGSRTITVRADIKSGISGQTVGVKLNSLTVVGGSATTFTNVNGNQLQVADVPNLTKANFDLIAPVLGGRDIDAGTTNLSVWSKGVNIGNHDAKLNAATFRFIGSAPTDAVANLSLYIDSVKVAGPAVVNAANDNKVTFDLGNTPYVLLTGTHTIELRGDIVKGSSRSISFAVENAGDLLIEDSQLAGVNVTPSVDGVGKPFQRLVYDTFNVKSGTITVNTDPAFVTNNVTGGASNMVIGQFTFKAYGEDVKVNSLSVQPLFNGVASSTATLNNVTIYVNGGQVGTSQNYNAAGSLTTANLYNLGSSLIVPAGTTVTVAVKADLRTTSGDNYKTGSISAKLVQGSSNAQGQSSYSIANVPSQSLAGTALTVTSGAGSFSRTAGFTSTQTITPNTSNVKLGSFTIQAGSAEGLVITGATILAGTSTGSFQNISNLTVKDGSVVLSSPIGQVNSINSVNFNSITVPVNGVKTFDVYADIGSATSTDMYMIGMTLNYRGAISNSVGLATDNGAQSTVKVALLANASLVSSSPSAQFVVGGATQNIATFKLSTQVSGTLANVREIDFALSSTDAIESVTVGGVTAPVVNNVAKVTGLNLSISSTGTDVPVTVKYAGFQNSTTGGSLLTSRTNVTVGISYIEATSGSGAVLTNSVAVTSSAMTLVASKPTVSVPTTQGGTLILGAENKVGEFTVSADANGKISVGTTTINLSAVGFGSPVFSAPRIADGNTSISNATATMSTGTSVLATFAPTYEISAGQSKTFSVFVTVAGSSTVGVAPYVASSLTASGFKWRDTIGGDTQFDGLNIINFPTNSYTTSR
jgi:hypothetical protein